MDPLSMTASVITILELTSKLTSYINDVRKATKEQKQVAMEASNLYSLFTRLRFRVEEAQSSSPWFNQVKLLGVENGPLDQFKSILKKMVEQIPSSKKRDQVKSALTWKFTKAEVENALRQMERLKTLIHCALTDDLMTLARVMHDGVSAIQSDVEDLGGRVQQVHIGVDRLQSLADDDLQHRIAQWLNVPDPSTNYHAALKKRHPETGLWLVNGPHFHNWKGSVASLMWLHGNAGCGKTVLSAAALQTILQVQQVELDTAVSYFYFDFNDVEKQSSSKAVRSLLFQFARQTVHDFRGLEQLYQRCGNGQQQPADDTIQSLLQEVIKQIKSKYIILDALDECTDREDLLNFVCDLTNSKVNGLRVMATSRREREIEESLRGITEHNINIQSSVVDEDIRMYIQDRLATDNKLKKLPRSIREEIISTMMSKASGMFRWVFCQIDSIRNCLTPEALRQALSSLPKTLDETYDRILQSIESKGQQHNAIKVLRWLCFSGRPLTVSEMVEVLAIENGVEGGFFPEKRLWDPADIMVVCSSLISYSAVGYKGDDDDSDDEYDSVEGDIDLGPDKDIDYQMVQVQLAHSSVKEYLLSDRCALSSDFQAQVCHSEIAESSLRYLLYLSNHAPLTGELVDQHPHPLAPYAAEYWWQHARNMDEAHDRTVLDLALTLLTAESASLLLWVQLYDPDEPLRGVDDSLLIRNLASPLYFAASIGVSRVVQQMIMDRGAEVNAQGGRYGNALQAASVDGHEKVVQLLLDRGAEVNAQGGRYGNALQAASVDGHEKVVQLLLDRGAEVNAQGGRYGNALQAASVDGHEKVVQLLLDRGAEVNAQGGRYGNALQAASVNGREKVVQLLLDRGAEVNAQGGPYGNALQAALFYGHEKVVQLLLDRGAEVNAQGGRYSNALQAASFYGHEKVVQLLLDRGAEVNAQGGRYSNALQAASVNGREKVVQLLLDRGAEVNAQGGPYSNALQAASVDGHEKVVQLLLDRGAEVNAQGGRYGNALQAASVDGHEKVVQLLVAAGARDHQGSIESGEDSDGV